MGMNMTVSLFSEKFLKGNSELISDKTGINKKLDLVIFSLGWESRLLNILKYDSNNFVFNEAIILRFKHDGEKGYDENIREELVKYIRKKTTNIHEIDIELSNKKIQNEPMSECLKDLFLFFEGKRGFTSIGLEFSSCPRRVLLYLVGIFLSKKLAKNFVFFYSEGKYPENESFNIGKGDWKLIAISEYNSHFNFLGKRFYIFSTGFELNRYRSLIANDSPFSIGLLMPIPGFIDKYTKQARSVGDTLTRDYNIPSNNLVCARAGDAIEAWKNLNKLTEKLGKYNITFLPFGPKPHVLAMGLHGFLNDNITVVYRIPKAGYTKTDVPALGRLWSYEIENLLNF
jgi:hypothetical protein